MILSRACKYGLQAVLHLARHDQRPLLSKEIAQALSIPQHFLAKILQDLSRRGLLQSFKGRGGGFKLARPADNIRLLDVVETIEGGEFDAGCVLGLRECSDEKACPVHYQWKQIKAQILSMLSDKSVRGLLEDTASQCLLAQAEVKD
jgi:Rrf2 family iron-sulfur cluster assembly transcriptional regulator